MTTSIKIRTNGDYVAEAKNLNGLVLGHAGPGNNVESNWIGVPHTGFTVSERSATPDEIATAKKAADTANARQGE